MTSQALTLGEAQALCAPYPGTHVIVGTDGNDVLDGTNAADCIVAGKGNDIINGGNNNDIIFAGDGDDTINGGNGSDLIYGGSGNDVIQGGNDNDTIYAEQGDDQAYGDNGDDKLFMGPGNDRAYGGNGNDELHGEDGADLLLGENGNDRLFGEACYDRLIRGNGSDVVDGGQGIDACTGAACERAETSGPTCSLDRDCSATQRCVVASGMCVERSGEQCDLAPPPPPDAGTGCVPSAATDSTCNGVDDDCNGVIDEDYVRLPLSCGVGACARTAMTSCVAGAVVQRCEPGVPAASDATCNGIDEDCNGVADEDFVGSATSCGVGACAAQGQTRCAQGVVTDSCAPGTPAPSDSSCNGRDDDCDGTTDENYASQAVACGVGACVASGTTACRAGVVVNSCTAGNAAASDTVCNGIDDDCNGAVDEDFVGQPVDCGIGSCAAHGVTRCEMGQLTSSCVAASPATDDHTCDGRDDDCDGRLDEDYAGVTTSCGVGACARTSTTRCSDGAVTDSCAPGTPAHDDASCDGVDSDCDGRTDEDYAATQVSCGSGACAASGTTACTSGAVVASCTPGTAAARDVVCNGIDDDCDGAIDDDFEPQATSCGVGACAAQGLTSCTQGVLVDSCSAGQPAAADDTCNNIDDDCDGTIDEDYAATETSCGTGACTRHGATRCEAGVVLDSCTAGLPGADDHVCNGIDDDCDGRADEEYVIETISCGSGACTAQGSTSCVNGQVVRSCTPGSAADRDDVCNGVDDDCDGSADEDFAASVTHCGVGACAATGIARCTSGIVSDSCTPGTGAASDASCDGIDDDCDGTRDEDYEAVATRCGVGACAAVGSTACVQGAVVDSCAPRTPASSDATCDAVDDDCDGRDDEDFAGLPTSCGLGACASNGQSRCEAGLVVSGCVPGAPAADDTTCNDIDDDCGGSRDEDYQSVATTCGVGACATTGHTDCVGGNVQDTCRPIMGAPDDHTCDGIDDDCSGVADEDYVPQSIACGVGACLAVGQTACEHGSIQSHCTPRQPAADDRSCDGVDDDCDGAVDNGYVPTETTCQRGGCLAEGELVCSGGIALDTCPSIGACIAETNCADGQDNDGDGARDCRDSDCLGDPRCRETDCYNGIDDNGNGSIDCADPTCAGGPPCIAEICGNSLDDDGDGLIDCADLADCENTIACPPVPPRAETVAPPLDTSAPTQAIDIVRFLYEGADPIQRGVVPGTMKEDRVALITGRVLSTDGGPLAAIAVDVLGHPEFGMTRTNVDGRFQLAVNGGQTLTLTYRAPGYNLAQRQVETQWQLGGTAADVVLVPHTHVVSTVDVGGTSTSYQVASGPTEVDTDGSRRSMLVIPPGLGAQVLDESGTRHNVPSLNLRMTEFTVGEHGRARMPGPLPASSAYTYAVSLTPDEANGAKYNGVDTVLSQPVPFYVDNFLGFPAGTPIPTGYYDDDSVAWKPIDNGITLKILAISGGMATLDSNGDGQPDNAATLAALGITDGERAVLATRFAAGASAWRVLLPHFSTFDLNMGAGCAVCDAGGGNCQPCPAPPTPPTDDEGNQGGPPNHPDAPMCTTEGNSSVNCFTQTLGEEVAVPGTPYTLAYRSDRQRGRKANRVLSAPIGSLVGTEGGEITFAPAMGVPQRYSFKPGDAVSKASWSWDGKDAFGRLVNGSMAVRVNVSHVHPCSYSMVARFGYPPANGVAVSSRLNTRGDCESLVSTQVTRIVEARDYRDQGIGGWSLSPQHNWDTTSSQLLYGGGERSYARQAPQLTFLLDSTSNAASYNGLKDLVVTEDGTIYATGNPGLYRKLPNAAPTLWFPRIDCTPAQATANIMCEPVYIDLAPNGDLIVTDGSGTATRIIRITRAGTVTRIAGGLKGYSGDGGPALSAKLGQMCAMRVDKDGTIYFIDCTNAVVRRIDTSGMIATVAGTGVQYNFDGFTTTSDNARTVNLSYIGTYAGDTSPNAGFGGLAFDHSGGYYLIEGGFASCSIRHVDAAGKLTTLARREACYTDYRPGRYTGGTVDGNGDLLLADQSGGVWRIDPDAPYTPKLIAGAGANRNANTCGDLISMPPAQIFDSARVRLGPDGQVYIIHGCSQYSRLLKMTTSDRAPYGSKVIASQDRSEVYAFDAAGRHTATVHPLTGQALRTFEYDQKGFLKAIVEADGSRTQIVRDSSGRAQRIVAPFGQTTQLGYDAQGYLSSIEPDPQHAPYQFEYTTDGLITKQIDPRSTPHIYGFDEVGRVNLDQDPAGGFYTFDVTSTDGSRHVVRRSALGRVTQYDWTRYPDGKQEYKVTMPTGHINLRNLNVNTTVESTMIDGTFIRLTPHRDPVWGSDSLAYDEYVVTPAGQASSRTVSRSATLSVAGDPLSAATFVETVNDNGRVSTLAYAAATRTWTATSAVGRTSTATIDAQGRMLSAQSPGIMPLQLAYDERGRLKHAGQGTARTMDFGYDSGSGMLASTTNALGQATTFQHDAVGRVTSTHASDGGDTALEYDGESNLIGVTPPGRPRHGLRYTPVDLPEYYDAPSVGAGATTTRNEYNLDRQPKKISLPGGQTIAHAYNATTGQLTSTTVPDGSYTWQYDTKDRLSGIATTGGFGAMTFGYDGSLLKTLTVSGPHSAIDNGTTRWSGALGGVVSLGYTNAFELRSLDVRGTTGPVGFSAVYNRDNDDLVTSVAPASGTTVPTYTLTRSPQDGHISAASLGIVSTTYTHDINTAAPGTADLLATTHRVGATALYSTSYQHDNLGRISRIDETISGATVTRAFEYDPAGRLSVVRDGSGIAVREYGYDTNGARTRFHSQTQDLALGTNIGCGATLATATDAQDRLCRYGDFQYSYDANGQLETKEQLSTGAVTRYHYDVLGRMRAVELPSGMRVDYVLDAAGRRIGKVVNGVLQHGWLYGPNSLQPLAQFNAAGQLEATYVYATRVNVPDYIVMVSGPTYRVLTDHLGSPRLIVDAATGAVAQRMDYDEFGNVLVDTNPGFQPFGFAGGLYDVDTRLVRLGARDYDALTGRWTAKDPIGFAGGDANLYAYVGSDPVNRVDPEGLFVPLLIAACVAGGCEAVASAAVWGAAFLTAGVAGATVAHYRYAIAETWQDLLTHNRHTADQEALKDLANEASTKGRSPICTEDADTILDWAGEYQYPGARALPEDVTGDHPGTEWDGKPHIHIPGSGRGGHHPVEPGVRPR